MNWTQSIFSHNTALSTYTAVFDFAIECISVSALLRTHHTAHLRAKSRRRCNSPVSPDAAAAVALELASLVWA